MISKANIATQSPKIKPGEFQEIRKIIHAYCGIDIHEGKEALVHSRLMKRIRKLGLTSFAEYLALIKNGQNKEEFLAFVDVLTTNKTNFFREAKHFDFFRNVVIPQIKGREVKWWSAGCSTGEEAITCAITLLEEKQRAKILATDISREVLEVAKAGCYPASKVLDVPDALLKKYFKKMEGNYFPKNEIRKMITYGRLNLTDNWPMKGPFQLIMCRNVMIYFNRKTQYELVRKFYQLLEPGGYLFLGHSEGIPKESQGFRYLAPAVYQKV